MWSDPRLIQRASAFVPAADETWRMQRGDDPESRFFQAMADGGHYRAEGGTRQGIYVCAPSGRLLASTNALDPDLVIAALEAGVLAWKVLPEEERRLPADADLRPAHRWEDSFPERGLVLETTCRDLPPDRDPAHTATGPTNHDHVWYAANEVAAWFDVPTGPGTPLHVDPRVAMRLARFHLVDSVRGQTLPFAREEVEEAILEGEVVGVEGPRVRLRLTGRTRAATDGTWRLGENDWTPDREWPRGVETSLLGRATWNGETRSFDAFELVAVGSRWGRTRFNARGRTEGAGPEPIGFVLSLAGREPADRIAPAFVDVYDAPWIVRPAASARR